MTLTKEMLEDCKFMVRKLPASIHIYPRVLLEILGKAGFVTVSFDPAKDEPDPLEPRREIWVPKLYRYLRRFNGEQHWKSDKPYMNKRWNLELLHGL